jgi:hypothetical protein
MGDQDTIHRHWKKIATIWGIVAAAIAALGTIVAAWVTFEKDYKPLPAKVAALEGRLSKLGSPSESTLEWVGVWNGKWNDTWKVQFTIFYMYGDTYFLIYSHQDQADGPMTPGTFEIGKLEGSTLTWRGRHTIRRTSQTTAEAIGVFTPGRGVQATLTRSN